MILALDTALRKSGYAVGPNPASIIECGILWAAKVELPEDRALSVAEDAICLVKQYGVTQIIMEMPAPQAPSFHRYDKASGQTVPFMPQGQADYGVACGTIKAELRHRLPGVPIERVRSDLWSQKTKKAAHKIAAKLLHSGYDEDQDPDGDAADAVCLLAWLVDRQSLLDALAVGKLKTRRTINHRKIVKGIFRK